MERGSIEILPIRSGTGSLKVDPQKALKVISAITSLCLGPKGVPSFLSNIGEIGKVIRRELGPSERIQSQGFALFTGALTDATVSLLKMHAPHLVNHTDSKSSISSIILNSLDREPINISSRFLVTPALNPAFIRVRESIQILLERPLFKIEAATANLITSSLGREFVKSLESAVQTLDAQNTFKDFLTALDSNHFSKPANRASMWDDYRADLNKQIYRRLFLHELDSHPDITLPEIYIPSRAVYSDSHEIISDDTEKTKIYCVDLKEELKQLWLSKPIVKSGHSRLVTGDPGTGKSTFSLMFAKSLAEQDYRVLFIPANSIRSLNLSFEKIVVTHIQRTLRLETPPDIEQIVGDYDSTGKPLFIVLDGLDEYDVGGTTVSIAAGRLVDHVMTVMDEWHQHGNDVRLLLCGRPEAASSITRFRGRGRHLHVTGFVHDFNYGEEAANDESAELISIDQREQWWRRWQELHNEPISGLPSAIAGGRREVAEITAQPLLNYMLAVLKLYDADSLTNLSALYGSLFDRYYERQSTNSSGTFAKLCPSLDRFKRVMSEIGVAAWHAGDRSVSVEDLQRRFDKPPLKSWFDQAGAGNSGLGAILSAFYTRPEDAASPDSGLAQRYVFTHKSFREYLTAVGLVRFLERLTDQLSPDAEDGWSDKSALLEWLALFGMTSIDQRQWQFLSNEVQTTYQNNHSRLKQIKSSVERLFNLSLHRQMPTPLDSDNIGNTIKKVGNAEEALVCVLSAIRHAEVLQGADAQIIVDWPYNSETNSTPQDDISLLIEFVHRARSRPGSPDEMLMYHLKCVLEKGSKALNNQVNTSYRNRPDGWAYARIFDFTGMDIKGCDFSSAQLIHSRFHRTTMAEANFSNSSLGLSDFCHATSEVRRDDNQLTNFDGADISQSRWLYSSVRGTWKGAILYAADIRGVDQKFQGANVRRIIKGVLYAGPFDEPEEALDKKPKLPRKSAQ